jgi:hypothetical protein
MLALAPGAHRVEGMAARFVSRKQLKEGIKLLAGEPHELTLTSDSQPSFLVDGAVFAFDSAFPAAGTFQFLEIAQAEFTRRTESRLVVFGHTDVVASLAFNKNLSDQRAKATLALIKRDVKLLEEVSAKDKWDTSQYQAMLRALGCNPGAIDGSLGPMTEAAVRGFQEEYNEDVYHQGDAPKRANPNLAIDGKLGPKTEAALRDAYVARSPVRVTAAQLNKPAFAGCSELNPISTEDAVNRRLALALVRPNGPKTEDFPCREGDISACPVDRDSGIRCPFYRENFADSRQVNVLPFFDFRWLRESSGTVHLSALTTLPDGTSVRFSVLRWQLAITNPMPNSRDTKEKPSDPGSAVATLIGQVRGGVAFTRWEPPSDFDPFDHSTWLVDHDLQIDDVDDVEDESITPEQLLAAQGATPPVFLVEADEQRWAFSFPPGQNLDEIRITNETDGTGMAIGFDMGLVPWESSGGRAKPSVTLPGNVAVLSLLMASRQVSPEPSEGDGEALI